MHDHNSPTLSCGLCPFSLSSTLLSTVMPSVLFFILVLRKCYFQVTELTLVVPARWYYIMVPWSRDVPWRRLPYAREGRQTRALLCLEIKVYISSYFQTASWREPHELSYCYITSAFWKTCVVYIFNVTFKVLCGHSASGLRCTLNAVMCWTSSCITTAIVRCTYRADPYFRVINVFRSACKMFASSFFPPYVVLGALLFCSQIEWTV